MASVHRLSSLLLFLLPALLLLSLIGKTTGIPLSAGGDVIHAIQPTCTTLPGGSTSCNVGINTIPPLVTLDGGYQWLTVEPTTTTDSGSTLTTNEAVWTASQISYLTAEHITITSNGATIVSTSTEYVSFITTTTSPAGTAPTALIAAAIIAPALVGTLQPIVDSAGRKTVADIASEIVSAFASSGVVLSKDQSSQLATVLLAYGLIVGAQAGSHVYHSYTIKPYLANINVMPNPPSNPLPTTVQTTSSLKTATVIADPAYTNYKDFQGVVIIASGPTPTDGDLGASTSTSPAATAKCTPSNGSVDVVEAQALANKFCTGLDLSKSSSTAIQGNATGLQNTYGSSILFNFSQTANTCNLGCNMAYNQIITASTTAAPPSATTSTPSPPTPTLSPPELQSQQCYDANQFGRHSDIEGKVQSPWANDFCKGFDREFTSATPPVMWNSRSIIYNGGISPYHWTVSWIDGCATTATQQSMSNPLPDNPSVSCSSLLIGNWRNCNNGGAGGTIDAGCLRYNFAATKDQTQIS
ncbi:hypothetical protein OIDMADRAFT_30801 [Oidiodendron maius Zn]|uniref:Uncharacterized protein n=1 Tax=Oidiodendron maius (strain Zn) TaxID=913774 RepID=A0A0C3GT45_OIDMZ|nr:hypothetical protein OIDMADRAFT_30801 [Oidiodendron maius Zn]